jgi:tetratricopeptide (TPR) repeat protein
MLEHYNFSNLLFMGKNTTQRIDEIQDPFDKLAKQLDRAETYYSTLMKALNPFAQDVQELLKRLTVTQKAEIHLAQSEKTWNDYLTYAASLITAENYPDAEAALHKTLELNPECGDAHYYLGKIYYEQNRFASAISTLNKARAFNSKLPNLQMLLEQCQERNQHWHGRGEEIRKRFLANDPSDTGNEKERLLKAGNFYFGVKDYTRAEKEYLKAIYENPNLSDAYYHLGHTYFAMNDFDRGVDALTSALNCSPDNPAIYRDLGLVSIDRGLVEAAEKFLLKALELKPDDLELKETLGNIYFNNGRFDKAVKMYEDILSINPAYKELTKTLGIAYQKLISKNFQSREAGVN